MRENFSIKGKMSAKLYSADGVCKQTTSSNVILNDGFDFIAAAIGSSSRPAIMNIIAVGTGSTSQTPEDVGLETQIAEQEAQYSHTEKSKQFSISTNFGPGVATGAITEAGVKNASGTFIDRTTFEVINKGEADSLELDFTFTMG